jgi:hypothetical protein
MCPILLFSLLHIVVVQRDLKRAIRSLSGIAGPNRSQLPLTPWHSESSFDYPHLSHPSPGVRNNELIETPRVMDPFRFLLIAVAG